MTWIKHIAGAATWLQHSTRVMVSPGHRQTSMQQVTAVTLYILPSMVEKPALPSLDKLSAAAAVSGFGVAACVLPAQHGHRKFSLSTHSCGDVCLQEDGIICTATQPQHMHDAFKQQGNSEIGCVQKFRGPLMYKSRAILHQSAGTGALCCHNEKHQAPVDQALENQTCIS